MTRRYLLAAAVAASLTLSYFASPAFACETSCNVKPESITDVDRPDSGVYQGKRKCDGTCN